MLLAQSLSCKKKKLVAGGETGGSALSGVGESMNNCLHVINQSFILEACLLNFQNVYFIYLDPLTVGCWQTYDLQYATAVNQLKDNPGRVLLAARCNNARKTNTKQFRCTSEHRQSLQASGIQKEVYFILKALIKRTFPAIWSWNCTWFLTWWMHAG